MGGDQEHYVYDKATNSLVKRKVPKVPMAERPYYHEVDRSEPGKRRGWKSRSRKAIQNGEAARTDQDIEKKGPIKAVSDWLKKSVTVSPRKDIEDPMRDPTTTEDNTIGSPDLKPLPVLPEIEVEESSEFDTPGSPKPKHETSFLDTSATDNVSASVVESSNITDTMKLFLISNHVLEAAQTATELQGPWAKDPVGAVMNLLDKYRVLGETMKESAKESTSPIFDSFALEHEQAKRAAAEEDLKLFKRLKGESDEALRQAKQEFRSKEAEWIMERDHLKWFKTDHTRMRQENEHCKRREREWTSWQTRIGTEHDIALRNARNESAPELARLREKIKDHQFQLQQARDNALEENAGELSRLTNQVNVLENERGNLINAHEDQLRDLINNQTEKLRELADDHTEQLRILANGHTDQLRDLKESYFQELEKVRKNAARDKSQATEAIKTNWSIEVAGLKKTINDAKYQHTEALRIETERHQALEGRLQGEIDRLGEQHPRDIQALEGKLRKEYEERLKSLQTKYDNLNQEWEKKTLKVRTDYERLKIDWLDKRDHYQGLTDLELADKFKRLATKIEQFSMRVKWELSRETRWPMSDYRLKQFNPENPRRLKQQILQNSMWMTLHDEVFGTPFVVLGREGEVLDSEWRKEFDSSPTSKKWPKPSPKAEEWRYTAAKIYFDSLEQKGPLSDADKKHRDAFEASVASIVKDMFGSIGKVASIGLSEQQSLRDIVGQAGKLWLEVCSQRYRIRVDYPHFENGSNVDILTETRSHHNFLALIIRPDLVRVGNSLGEDLTMEESVSGWYADMVTHEPE